VSATRCQRTRFGGTPAPATRCPVRRRGVPATRCRRRGVKELVWWNAGTGDEVSCPATRRRGRGVCPATGCQRTRLVKHLFSVTRCPAMRCLGDEVSENSFWWNTGTGDEVSENSFGGTPAPATTCLAGDEASGTRFRGQATRCRRRGVRELVGRTPVLEHSPGRRRCRRRGIRELVWLNTCSRTFTWSSWTRHLEPASSSSRGGRHRPTPHRGRAGPCGGEPRGVAFSGTRQIGLRRSGPTGCGRARTLRTGAARSFPQRFRAAAAA
jgi:hypothetical protein